VDRGVGQGARAGHVDGDVRANDGQAARGFLTTAGPAKKAAEQQVEAGLSALGLPSRRQVVDMARQIVQLEEKVDGLEDRLDAILKRLNELGTLAKAERV